MHSFWLHWSNYTQEFILSTIGVMHERVERGEADLLVEANSSGVEGGYAQAPHSDGKVLLTNGQPPVLATCAMSRTM
jgi:hypothetical protein